MGLFDSVIILTELEAQTSRETCQLLGNAFGYCIQLSLGFIAFTALLFKRYRVPKSQRRGWAVWGRDVSKQGIGAAVAHGWNMVFSLALSGDLKDGNPCVFYLVNFVVDSLFGCLGNFILIFLIVKFAFKWKIYSLETGHYGDPPKTSTFLLQLGVWLWVVTIVKVFFLYSLIIPAQGQLYKAAEWFLSPVSHYPKVELAIVMIIIPLVLNVFVFWVTDNFLMKHKAGPTGQQKPGGWCAYLLSCGFCPEAFKFKKGDEECPVREGGAGGNYTLASDVEHDHEK